MGYDTTNKAYLAFYYPDECDLHEGMPFNCTIIEVKTNLDHTKELVDKAYRVLNGDMPDPSPDCDYCKWIEDNRSFF